MRKQLIKLLSMLTIAGMLFSIAGCAEFTLMKKEPEETKIGDAVSYEAKLTPKDIVPFSGGFTDGMNQFGFDVMLELYDEENISVSPASLELALLMTAMGGTDTTKEEMLSSLRMEELSDEEIRDAVAQLMWRSNNNGMEAANSLWLQKDYGFSTDYLDICADDFMADLFTVDYISDTSGATSAINDWANDKTHGKIPKILNDELSADTRMVLVNALYFLGDWASPFEAESTYDSTFHGTKSDTDVPFMHDERTVAYYEGDTFQLISLSFKGDDENDGPFAMAFILPKEGYDPEDVMIELSDNDFAAQIAQTSYENVRMSLPKFEFDYGTSMVETMKRLGMEEAFTGEAQFDPMTGTNNDLFISAIIHKTYIRVDEEGAEAAAVTAVVMDLAAMPIEEEYISFTADHPFLFAIYDTTDNTVLFTGVTADFE